MGQKKEGRWIGRGKRKIRKGKISIKATRECFSPHTGPNAVYAVHIAMAHEKRLTRVSYGISSEGSQVRVGRLGPILHLVTTAH